MQITCEKCASKYNLADEKIKDTGTAVRCPKCSHVFKVFPPAAQAEAASSVSCANCGKDTPAKPGMSVVFCADCQRKLTDPPPAETAPEPPPAPESPAAGGALFEDDPFGESASGDAGSGGVFDDAPAAPAGADGGLFDDAPAGGDMFDDGATASDGGLFDAGASGGGLFDDVAGGQEADPFGDFDAPAGSQQADPFGDFGDDPVAQGDDPFGDAPAGGAEADPFGDFSEPAAAGTEADPFADDMGGVPPEDDLGFSEPADSDPFAEPEKKDPKFKPAPERKGIEVKQVQESGSERIIALLSDNAARIGIFAGGALVVALVGLVAAMAFLPATFGARPAVANDRPGMLARLSFKLQEVMGSQYYGQAMEQTFVESGRREMELASGVGFKKAEEQFKQLLRLDRGNASANQALLELYATWDLLEEGNLFQADIAKLQASVKGKPEVTALALLALGQAEAVTPLLPSLGAAAPLYAALVTRAAGDNAQAVSALAAYTTAERQNFFAGIMYAHALRDVGRYADAVSAYERAGSIVGGNAKAFLEIGKIRLTYLEQPDEGLKAFQQALVGKLGASALVKAEANFHAARVLHERGRGSEALSGIQSALADFPNNARYLTTLGDIQFDSGKIVDAYGNYDKAKTSDPNYVDAWIGLARTNYRLEKVDLAIENFKQALSIDASYPRASFLYAELLNDLGRADEAEATLREALKRNPRRAEVVDRLADFYVDQQRFDEALELYNRLIGIAPDSIDGYVGRGVVLVRRNRLAAAKDMFGRAAAIEPENPSVLFRFGQAAYLEGDFATAERSLGGALEKQPSHWEARLYLGMTMVKLKRFNEALGHYQKALDVNARAAEVFRQRALAYWLQGNGAQDAKESKRFYDSAVRDFEQAIRYRDDDPDYYYDYGVALDSAGMAGKARDAWEKARKLRPDFKEALYRLARYYVVFLDFKKAESMLQEVIAKAPRDSRAHVEMGKVYLATGRTDDAQKRLARAISLDGRNSEALALMGEVYEQNLDMRNAVRYFERALKADPRNGQAYFHLGLYYKDRNPTRARELFRRSIDTGTLPREKVEEAQIAIRELEYVKQ